MNGKKRNNHSPSISITDLEQATSDAQVGQEESQGQDTRASILVHSRRRRLTDPDGVSAKAAIDGLVKAGILIDDSPIYVKEVVYSQEKIKKEEEEETIITIRWDGATIGIPPAIITMEE